MVVYFTCKSRTDGIGAQACGIISIIVVAQAFGLEYVYTPLKFVAHYPYPNPSATEKRLWCTAWEQLLNFGHKRKLITKTPGKRIHLDHRQIDGHFRVDDRTGKLSCDFKTGELYSTRETHTVLSRLREHPRIAEAWTTVLCELREGYGRSREDTPHFNLGGYINIAVHVRRGDSTHTTRRFVGHDYFVNVLDDITNYLEENGKQYTIQLYSEGKREDLPEFEKYKNISYRLNDDHFDTLHHMICADVLVMSKSTFSYLPALLNDGGTIVYKPFWLLPPQPLADKWIVADEHGHIEKSLLSSSV